MRGADIQRQYLYQKRNTRRFLCGTNSSIPMNHNVRRLQDRIGEKTQLQGGLGLLIQGARVFRQRELALHHPESGCLSNIEGSCSGGQSTFHCVILDRYPIDAVQLNIHMSSACAGTYIPHHTLSVQNRRLTTPFTPQTETYRALIKYHTPLWIQTHRQHRRQHPAPPPPQRFGLLRHRDGVQINDRVQQLGVGYSIVL